jgi:hypothetical protein
VNGCHGNKNKTFYILNAFHIKFSFAHKDFHFAKVSTPKLITMKIKKHFFPKNLKEATNDYF